MKSFHAVTRLTDFNGLLLWQAKSPKSFHAVTRLTRLQLMFAAPPTQINTQVSMR